MVKLAKNSIVQYKYFYLSAVGRLKPRIFAFAVLCIIKDPSHYYSKEIGTGYWYKRTLSSLEKTHLFQGSTLQGMQARSASARILQEFHGNIKQYLVLPHSKLKNIPYSGLLIYFVYFLSNSEQAFALEWSCDVVRE